MDDSIFCWDDSSQVSLEFIPHHLSLWAWWTISVYYITSRDRVAAGCRTCWRVIWMSFRRFKTVGNRIHLAARFWRETSSMVAVRSMTSNQSWYIYTRGIKKLANCNSFSIAIKGILEALEFLLESGYQPKRSFFLGFGHDEEVSLCQLELIVRWREN